MIYRFLRKFAQKKPYNQFDIIKCNKIEVVYDVGANVGQYATELRKNGFGGKIISFEPISSVFQKLCQNMAGDKNWIGENVAIGGENKNEEINVSEGTFFSSFKKLDEKIKEASPEASVSYKEVVKMTSLEVILNKFNLVNKNMLLKLDTQGFDFNILKSNEKHLKVFKVIQTELSLTPIYENQAPIEKVIEYLRSTGFEICLLVPGYFNHIEKKYMEYDGFFVRK